MKEVLASYKNIFDCHLKTMLEEFKCDIQPIFDALCYGIGNGGKRIRPTLCYMAAELCGKDVDYIKNIAVGIEMIHSYSLVHDDLPCMDNDDLRRGKPTAHIVFGEGMAVLAGDALLNMAFEVMLSDNNFDNYALSSLRYIAKNAGVFGMIGGQCLDLSNENNSNYNLEDLTKLNRLKTSCLLKSALVGSAIRCGATSQTIDNLEIYADCVGEIFQIVDDILDRTSTAEALGKQVNQDSANGKKSVVDIMGIEKAQAHIKDLQALAISKILPYGENAQKLIDLCKFLSERTN